MMTVLPLGPRVAATAFARTSTPLSMPCLASLPKTTSLEAKPLFWTAAFWMSLAGRGRAARERRGFIFSCFGWMSKWEMDWREEIP